MAESAKIPWDCNQEVTLSITAQPAGQLPSTSILSVGRVGSN